MTADAGEGSVYQEPAPPGRLQPQGAGQRTDQGCALVPLSLSRPPSNSSAGMPAAALADLIRRGELSAAEVVQDHLDRIADVDQHLNALVHVAGVDARREARAVDEARARGDELGALAGIPFTVKDVISVAGMPLTAGSRALAGLMGTEDAPAVARVRAAGAICLGKTNTPEFALWMMTWNEMFGHTRNPLPGHLDRSPGGSSGGEAAAVASGMSAFGLGSDFGGSVRWPAHCTGLSSLRPTAGLVPAAGQLPGRRADGQWHLDPDSLQGRLQVVGPIAHTVEDVGLITNVLADRFVRLPPHTVELATVDITWSASEGTVPTDPAIGSAMADLAEDLGRLRGRPVLYRRPVALGEAVELFAALRAADQQHDIKALTAAVPPGRVIADLLSRTGPVLADGLEDLWHRLALLEIRMDHEMPDVLILPVAAVGAPRLDEREFLVDGKRLGGWDILAPAQAVSLFGYPAATVPVATFGDGRPIAVQVVGRRGRDDLVLAVAEQIQSMRGVFGSA